MGPEQRQTKPSLRGIVTGFTGDHASHFLNGGTKFFLTEPRTQPRDGNSALVTIGTTGSNAIMYVTELSFSHSVAHELRDTLSPCHRSCEQW